MFTHLPTCAQQEADTTRWGFHLHESQGHSRVAIKAKWHTHKIPEPFAIAQASAMEQKMAC